jgi:LEA14-like dessication related protein
MIGKTRQLAALCLLGAGLLGSGCSYLRGASILPTADVQQVRYESAGLEALTLLVDIRVKNPYAFSLPLTGLDYTLSSGNTTLITGKSDVSQPIEASASETVTVPVKILYLELIQKLGSIPRGRDLNYRAEMRLHAKAPAVGALEIPLTYSGTLPLPNGI